MNARAIIDQALQEWHEHARLEVASDRQESRFMFFRNGQIAGQIGYEGPSRYCERKGIKYVSGVIDVKRKKDL